MKLHAPPYAGPGCSVITTDGTLGVVICVRRESGVQIVELATVGGCRLVREAASVRRLTDYDAREALRATEVSP